MSGRSENASSTHFMNKSIMHLVARLLLWYATDIIHWGDESQRTHSYTAREVGEGAIVVDSDFKLRRITIVLVTAAFAAALLFLEGGKPSRTLKGGRHGDRRE